MNGADVLIFAGGNRRECPGYPRGDLRGSGSSGDSGRQRSE
jgi:hypothetical protein